MLTKEKMVSDYGSTGYLMDDQKADMPVQSMEDSKNLHRHSLLKWNMKHEDMAF